MNLLDISSNSPHYFYSKRIVATNKNFNLILGLKGLTLQLSSVTDCSLPLMVSPCCELQGYSVKIESELPLFGKFTDLAWIFETPFIITKVTWPN